MNPIIVHSTHPEQLKIHSEESHIKKFSECSYPERILSDDINATAFQPIVEPEENNPNFKYPPNWKDLSKQDKANLIVISNMIKLICVADLSSHYSRKSLP